MIVDLRLLIILVCVCPPAGMACWLLSLRGTALPRAWLLNARPWQRLLAGAIIAGAEIGARGGCGAVVRRARCW
jgi:hypothetical protein